MAASHGLLLWLLLLLLLLLSHLFTPVADRRPHRNELAASLRCINVWLHPNETTALIEALDQDNSDSIDEAEFILFWNRTT
jgi:Ca2+-binding EF-hand superfamily protein